eukprot:272337_1
MARQSSTKHLSVGDKLENAMHNVGEIMEEKTNVVMRKNTRNMKRMKAANASDIVDYIIPVKLVRFTIALVVFLYGCIALICIVTLIVYCANHFVATFYDNYNEHENIFLQVIIGLCTGGSVLGLYGTFKYGAVDEQIQILHYQNAELKDKIRDIEHIKEFELQEHIREFELHADGIKENQNDLKAQIKAFSKLESALKSQSKTDNAEMTAFVKKVSTLFSEFKTLQREVEKANLLSLFYELEFSDDNVECLNETEYEMFIGRLDVDTASKFKMRSFKELDKNNDKTIDINEFQSELDRIYKRMNVSNMSKRKRDKNKGKSKKWNDWL